MRGRFDTGSIRWGASNARVPRRVHPPPEPAALQQGAFDRCERSQEDDAPLLVSPRMRSGAQSRDHARRLARLPSRDHLLLRPGFGRPVHRSRAISRPWRASRKRTLAGLGRSSAFDPKRTFRVGASWPRLFRALRTAWPCGCRSLCAAAASVPRPSLARSRPCQVGRNAGLSPDRRCIENRSE